MELKNDKTDDLQKFYNAVGRAVVKHMKVLNIDKNSEITAETGAPNTDLVQYYITTQDGKKKLLLKAKLTYKPFFEIKRYKI